ncbi:NUDIX domain-containing protein [Desulfobulbus sp.]|uniref:NUDIX hydrolase n=1 Tax=Desulfobulbus sp. TaxID=895 RepID=UPI00286F67E0|nr:NUDIX domain-containing protein [Desulfobulbus sp.]
MSRPSSDYCALHPIPAVRAIISDTQGRVLLLRRANTAFGDGAWCLPGGKVDCGQSAEEALAVELAEELSVRLERAAYLYSQDSPPDRTDGPHFLNLYFLCRVSGTIQLNEESSAQAWAGPAELAAYAVVFGHDEAIRRYFAEHAQPSGLNSSNLV